MAEFGSSEANGDKSEIPLENGFSKLDIKASPEVHLRKWSMSMAVGQGQKTGIRYDFVE